MGAPEAPPGERPERTPKKHVSFQWLSGQMPELRELPSFPQVFSAYMARLILVVICLLIAALLVAWWFTRPTLSEVQQILGQSAEAQKVLEAFSELTRDHFDLFRDLFQLVVLSILVPLFTLLAGYAFGSRERETQE
jgi:hypothetical protein